MLHIKYSIFILLFFLSACSITSYEHSQSKFITIKTKILKFSDLGYIKNTDNSVRLELFVAGNNIQNIEINNLICLNEGCMLRSSFNSEYLSENYPDTILQNIVLGKPVYEGKNFKKIGYGFEQKIQNSDVDILYKVSTVEIYFKDIKNKILFKIKDIK
ncbi:Putative lipoprotein [hydrothermal vent metagenome]|uniref:Putative lipoprotein n=1 Tax=hydrothermal vent metagenome TaxID=652676 RepID=A0A1W1BDK6_9ZZZZ